MTALWVKMRKTRNEHMSAALHPIADITRRGWHGRKVPKPAILRRPKIFIGKARSNEIKLAPLHSF
jgi:hypothetical protein